MSRIESSLLPLVKTGLDLGRTKPGASLGVYEVDPAATILAGQCVSRNAAGKLVLSTGSDCIGLAKWNKATQLTAVVKDEAIVLTGTSAIPLKHANVSQVRVTSLAGTAFATPADYTVQAVNGTVTRVGGGAITDGQTVLVSYRYVVLESDLDFEGRNFFNFIDDASVAQGKLTIIQGFSLVATAAYSPADAWAVNASVRVGADGHVTLAGAGQIIGKVVQVPTAADPYLLFELNI